MAMAATSGTPITSAPSEISVASMAAIAVWPRTYPETVCQMRWPTRSTSSPDPAASCTVQRHITAPSFM